MSFWLNNKDENRNNGFHFFLLSFQKKCFVPRIEMKASPVEGYSLSCAGTVPVQPKQFKWRERKIVLTLTLPFQTDPPVIKPPSEIFSTKEKEFVPFKSFTLHVCSFTYNEQSLSWSVRDDQRWSVRNRIIHFDQFGDKREGGSWSWWVPAPWLETGDWASHQNSLRPAPSPHSSLPVVSTERSSVE